jgi:pimeloyl-ACP methyl ester carboxylesterase
MERSSIRLGEVELEVWQGGTGPALVYLHGGGGLNPRAPFLQRLSEKFRVVAPSHPGFGASGLPEWLDSVDDFAYAHLDLLDRLGLEKITLIGNALGAWTAAEMATKNTSRLARLVLISPVGIKVGPPDRLEFPDIFALAPEKLGKLFLVEPEKFRPDLSKLTDEELLVRERNRETFALVAWEPYLHNPKLKRRLHRIDRPVLVLRGAADGLVSNDYAAAFARLIPGAKFETIADTAHAPEAERPEQMAARITAFAETGT